MKSTWMVAAAVVAGVVLSFLAGALNTYLLEELLITPFLAKVIVVILYAPSMVYLSIRPIFTAAGEHWR